MFCTTISGPPGMFLLRCGAKKRAHSSCAPPVEVPTTSLTVLPLKDSCESACATLENKTNPTKKKSAKDRSFHERLLQQKSLDLTSIEDLPEKNITVLGEGLRQRPCETER